MTLRDLILEELHERKCAHVDIFPDYYICSIGCHLFNLVNKAKQIYFEAGKVVDTRLHLLMVAPPGFSKTFWLDQFLEGEYSILGKEIDCHFEEVMTEAGWSGTIKFQNGTPYELPGAAKEYMYSIIGTEEFSALTEMMQQMHSRTLATQLLTSLDKGVVRKRIGGVKIDYQTYVTLWAGCQITRLHLTSGLGRRIFFLEFIPSKEDKKLLTQKRREAKHVRANIGRLREIRMKLKELKQKIARIEKVTFEDAVHSLFDKMKLPHFEEILYERLILGNAIMTSNLSSNVTAFVDARIKDMCERERKWRQSIQRGPEIKELLTLINEYGGKVDVETLKDDLLTYGKDWTMSTDLLFRMSRAKLIKLSDTHVELVKRDVEKM